MCRVSVGVCAHNEEVNIGRALDSLRAQELHGFALVETLVISSASTDRTDAIVEECAARDGRVRLIKQEERRGKSDAVNLFMEEAVGEVLVLLNADNILEEGALQQLLSPFRDPGVGMVGGHPVPVNGTDSLVGFSVNMLWEMHHRIAMVRAKTGELVAFRALGVKIPSGVNTDEDYLCSAIQRMGYRVAYAPKALVRNKGPESLAEMLAQRARVNIGEGYMRKRFRHRVPTRDGRLLIPLYIQYLKENRCHLLKALTATAIEMGVRAYSAVYVRLDMGDPYIWRMIGSSKRLE